MSPSKLEEGDEIKEKSLIFLRVKDVNDTIFLPADGLQFVGFHEY